MEAIPIRLQFVSFNLLDKSYAISCRYENILSPKLTSILYASVISFQSLALIPAIIPDLDW